MRFNYHPNTLNGLLTNLLYVLAVQLLTILLMYTISNSQRPTECFKKVAPSKTFWNILTLVKSFCVKFCMFVGNS